MAIVKSKPYIYGSDADGNRGIVVEDITVYSDVSGEEIWGDFYVVPTRGSDKIMSYREMSDYFGTRELDDSEGIVKLENGRLADCAKETIYEFDDMLVDENELFDLTESYRKTLYDFEEEDIFHDIDE